MTELISLQKHKMGDSKDDNNSTFNNSLNTYPESLTQENKNDKQKSISGI